jgi:hypothetical protein
MKYLLQFLKLVLLIGSFVFIGYKLTNTFNINERYLDFVVLYQPKSLFFFFLAFSLMFLNISLEVKKWMVLLKPYEQFTFKESTSAVVSGIALSIITPNQIGDFAGRVLNLNKLAKLKGALLAVIGYTAQVLTTIVFGLFAYWRLVLSKADMPALTAILCLLTAILSIFIFFNFRILSPLLNKFRFLKKYEESINVFKEQKSDLLLNVLILSVVRFCTYLVQFWLLLKFFQVEISAFDAFSAIISTFFVQSFVPSFLLLELGLRGSAAIWFIGMFSSNIPGILLASYTLWIINMLIPALYGYFIIYKIKT